MDLRRVTALLAVAALGQLSAPAWAAPLGEASGLDRARARLAAVRAGLEQPALLPALRALAALGEVAPAAPQRAAAPPIAGLPAALAAPVQRVLGAVVSARRETREAIRLSPQEARRAVLDLAEATERVQSAGRGESLRLAARLEDRYGAKVDETRLLGAAIELAAAIDEALPALRAAAPAVRSSTALPCDVLDASPALCVGGNGPNTYDADQWLQIDTGGDDVYRNTAGTGTILPPVSVVIDVAGNDLYEKARSAATAAPVQGSALLGIGMLVDAAGNDRYLLTDDPTLPSYTMLLTGQAYASFGVGVLDDREGNDVYELLLTAQAGLAEVQGQAYASFAGFALMADRGGNDRYVSSARPRPSVDGQDRWTAGGATTKAQGYGVLGGTAIFADTGGTDSMTIEAVAGGIGPEKVVSGFTQGNATSQGAGFATIGAEAVAVLGAGASTWEVIAESSSPKAQVTRAEGLAAAGFGALGAIVDGGGADVYRAEARSAAASLATSDACDCHPTSQALAGDATVNAIAVGQGGGVGIVLDPAGDDRYEVVATSTAGALAVDELESGARPIAISTAGTVFAAGQGAGALGGAGLLEDLAGNDVYDATATSLAQAEARSDSPDASKIASTAAGGATNAAQAHASIEGYASLRDLGGTDIFRATARSEGIPLPEGDAETGALYASVQGSAFGPIAPLPGDQPAHAFLLDADGGSADVFSSIPADPTCTGIRGTGHWLDCAVEAGGLNA